MFCHINLNNKRKGKNVLERMVIFILGPETRLSCWPTLFLITKAKKLLLFNRENGGDEIKEDRQCFVKN
jgi:hypothetical protein